jgi:hypothetical protein
VVAVATMLVRTQGRNEPRLNLNVVQKYHLPRQAQETLKDRFNEIIAVGFWGQGAPRWTRQRWCTACRGMRSFGRCSRYESRKRTRLVLLLLLLLLLP